MNFTRHCFDPWNYLEFRPDGQVSPCCMQKSDLIKSDFDLYDVRNSDAFRGLRKQLMVGELDSKCFSCGLRNKVSTEQFKDLLQEKFPELQDLQEPANQLEMVRIDITERCNLRCTYCAVSQPGYDGINDGSGTGVLGGREFPRERLAHLIEALAKYPNIDLIAVNGHGETTYYKDWQQYCARLIESGHKLSIISNFARLFEQDEVDALVQFKSIALSLDSVDPFVLKEVRRKVELSNIVQNIDAIRARAAELGIAGPTLEILSGVFDKNVEFLPKLAQFAVDKKFIGITFWKLLKYPDVNAAGDVKRIDQLSAEEILSCLSKADEAKAILVSNGLACHFTSDFIEEIRQNFPEFAFIKSCHITRDDTVIDISVQTELTDVTSTVKKYLFVIVGIGEQLFYLLPTGAMRPCRVTHIDESYFFAPITEKLQVIDIQLPFTDITARPVTLHLAAGANLGTLAEHNRYLTYPLLEAAAVHHSAG